MLNVMCVFNYLEKFLLLEKPLKHYLNELIV